MVKLTLIARVSDGLALAEGLEVDKDPELEEYKRQAQSVFKKLSQGGSSTAQRMTIESEKYVFHYILDVGVCFLTLAEKGYPKKLAFQYLEELSREFGRLYGTQVDTVTRPYAFIKFDTFIQKTKKLYLDTRTQRNLAKLNEDLQEVHAVMTKNIADVLHQGEKLDHMSTAAQDLANQSKSYLNRTKDLHTQALIRKYMPIAVVAAIVLALLWFRRWL